MSTANTLAAITLLTQLLERAAVLGNLVRTAQSEGRDVSDAELDILAAEDDAARARLVEAISASRQRNQGGRSRLGFLVGLLAVAGLALAAEPAVRQATLSWTPPTQYVDGSEIATADMGLLRYHVYRGARGTAPAQKTRIATNLATLQHVDTGRPIGVEECYQVTALFVGQPSTEGGPSAEGCKSHPRPAAGAPTLTVQ